MFKYIPFKVIPKSSGMSMLQELVMDREAQRYAVYWVAKSRHDRETESI